MALRDFVVKSGIITGGAITLPANPVNALEAATKQYVDSQVGGANEISFKTDGSQAMTGTLQLVAGSTTRAPLKFTSGALLTTPSAGMVEFDGTSFYITNNAGVRKTITFSDSTITGNAANVTGIVAVANGGTGASTAANALNNLGAVAKAGSTMTGFLTLSADPTNPLHAATKQYVDAVKQGLDIKDSVRVASTANVALSGLQTVDGVTLVAGDRVLLKDQTLGAENGIYVAGAAGWTRAIDADTSAKVTAGMFTFVTEGAVNGDGGFVLTTNDTITLGTTALTFTQFSGAGQITAGAGLVKSGNTIDVVGAANRITVNADNIDIAATYVGQTSITTLGTITAGTWNGTTIAAANGGTGLTSYTTGDLLYATGSTTLGKLADVATGNALLSGGVGAAPSWGKIGLTTHITGTLAIGNGGTGATTAAAARTNLGLGSIATQNTTAVAITGGTIDGTAIGTTTPSTGKFTSIAIDNVSAFDSSSVSVTTTTATTIDSFATGSWRSAKYVIQIADGTSFEIAEVLVIHDGTTAHITTYGNVFTSASSLGSFDATIATGTLSLTFTAAAATSKTVKVHRTALAV